MDFANHLLTQNAEDYSLAKDLCEHLAKNEVEFGDFLEIHFCNADPIDIEIIPFKIASINPKIRYMEYTLIYDNKQTVVPIAIYKCYDDPDNCYGSERDYEVEDGVLIGTYAEEFDYYMKSSFRVSIRTFDDTELMKMIEHNINNRIEDKDINVNCSDSEDDDS